MGRITLGVQKEFCAECTLALRRFIGKMEGVDSIDVESGKIVIDFNDLKVAGEDILRITRDSIDKLGYKIEG